MAFLFASVYALLVIIISHTGNNEECGIKMRAIGSPAQHGDMECGIKIHAIGRPARHDDEKCGIKMRAIGSPPQHGLLDPTGTAVWTRNTTGSRLAPRNHYQYPVL